MRAGHSSRAQPHVSDGDSSTLPPRLVEQSASEEETLQQSLLYHMHVALANRSSPVTMPVIYRATARSVRDQLIERWIDTELHYRQQVAAPLLHML